MTCLVLDDEPLALRIIENYLLRIPGLQPIGFFADPDRALALLSQKTVDLLFLDIQMPDVDGITFYRSLPQQLPVIFTTAYRRFAVEGFELNALDYLVKPFGFNRFELAVQRAEGYHRFRQKTPAPASAAIFVHSAYELTKILLSDLYAAEAFGDYLKLYLRSQAKPVITLLSLKKLQAQLPEKDFIRVHRSFVVAKTAISSRQGRVLRVEGLKVPVGRTYFPLVKKMFDPT